MDSNHRRACSSLGNRSINSKSEIPFLDDLPGVAGTVQTPIVRIPIPYLLQFVNQSWLVLYIIPLVLGIIYLFTQNSSSNLFGDCNHRIASVSSQSLKNKAAYERNVSKIGLLMKWKAIT